MPYGEKSAYEAQSKLKGQSPAYKKSSGFKMKGSPFLKDVKLYEGSGSQISVDDANLGEIYMDDYGNKARDYSYTKDGKKGTDRLYLSEPRFGGPKELKNPPEEQFYA